MPLSVCYIFWNPIRDKVPCYLLPLLSSCKCIVTEIGGAVLCLDDLSPDTLFNLGKQIFRGELRNKTWSLDLLLKQNIVLWLILLVRLFGNVIWWYLLASLFLLLLCIVITRTPCILPLIPFFMSASSTLRWIVISFVRNLFLELLLHAILLQGSNSQISSQKPLDNDSFTTILASWVLHSTDSNLKGSIGYTKLGKYSAS